ncbi:MAG TPA: hypothetical protein DEP28_10065 [Bacteroidetes bacterium]|nr:hypothetical protein [Bacteroidota bacterium]
MPVFVFQYLKQKDYIGKTRLLVIGENYPNPDYAVSCFYRSLPDCPGGPARGAAPLFFTNLCNAFSIPDTYSDGEKLTELERLDQFLSNGIMVMDAQQNNVAPKRPARVSSFEAENLLNTILFLDPEHIIFLTNNNIPVIQALSQIPSFSKIRSRILTNPITGTKVFAFPSPPANPNLFIRQINALKNKGLAI